MIENYAQHQFARDITLPGGIPVRAGDPLGSVGRPPWLTDTWIKDALHNGILTPGMPPEAPPAPGPTEPPLAPEGEDRRSPLQRAAPAGKPKQKQK